LGGRVYPASSGASIASPAWSRAAAPVPGQRTPSNGPGRQSGLLRVQGQRTHPLSGPCPTDAAPSFDPQES